MLFFFCCLALVVGKLYSFSVVSIRTYYSLYASIHFLLLSFGSLVPPLLLLFSPFAHVFNTRNAWKQWHFDGNPRARTTHKTNKWHGWFRINYTNIKRFYLAISNGLSCIIRAFTACVCVCVCIELLAAHRIPNGYYPPRIIRDLQWRLRMK